MDAEADTAHFKFADVAVGSAADFATVVFTGREFGFFAPLFD